MIFWLLEQVVLISPGDRLLDPAWPIIAFDTSHFSFPYFHSLMFNAFIIPVTGNSSNNSNDNRNNENLPSISSFDFLTARKDSTKYCF